MKYRVLISAPYFQDVIERFRPHLEENDIELVIPEVNERLEEDDLLEYIEDIHGIMCGDDRLTPRVLAKASKLKVISKWGTGIDSIDKEECERLGIWLCNTPNAFTEPVADSTLAYILCFARKTLQMDKAMKEGVWKKIPGFSLREKTLGIIGFGNIGKAVAKRASAFGMTILANDIKEIDQKLADTYSVKMVLKDEIYEKADFISMNCDLNDSSYHILDEAAFIKMKRTPFVINTARGPLVKEEALINALNDSKIAGAGLDVFEHEPIPKNSELLKMDNVLVAPHNSNSSPMAWERVHENTIKNLIEGLNNNER